MRFRFTDRSGTIAEAGKAQRAFPDNPTRNGAWIQNNSTLDLWLNELGPAQPFPPSLKLAPGQLYEFPEALPPSEISIYGTNAGQAFSAREW